LNGTVLLVYCICIATSWAILESIRKHQGSFGAELNPPTHPPIRTNERTKREADEKRMMAGMAMVLVGGPYCCWTNLDDGHLLIKDQPLDRPASKVVTIEPSVGEKKQ
jgi:hypothetical protein